MSLKKKLRNSEFDHNEWLKDKINRLYSNGKTHDGKPIEDYVCASCGEECRYADCSCNAQSPWCDCKSCKIELKKSRGMGCS